MITICCKNHTVVKATILSVLILLSTSGMAAPSCQDTGDCIEVTTKASLLHLGSLDSFDITVPGTFAAKLILDYLESGHLEAIHHALTIYDKIIPAENFGGEYTALQWLCEYFIATPEQQQAMLSDRVVASYYHLLADNDYAVLKEYLKRKYHLETTPTPARDKDEATLRHRFHEDVMLFNNPRRERWEKSSKILEVLGLKKGDVIADIGSGPGYYTFKFSDIVGDSGKVYAIDNNPRHNEYLTGLIDKYHIDNVQVVSARVDDIGLPPDTKVDYAFICSLYHIIYATFTEEERAAFVDSIKRSLKSDGTLVVIDNALVEDQTLPYHGPYIAKELIVAQLQHQGFRLVATHQFIPQRYILVFKLDNQPETPSGAHAGCTSADCIPITSAISLAQALKTTTGPGFTNGGRQAARSFYQALDKKDKEAAKTAIAQYQELIPKERFGDEYTAFVWFCDYILASDEEKKKLLDNKLTAEYFQHLGGDDFTILKQYVWNKYYLDEPDENFELGPGESNTSKTHRSIQNQTGISQSQINAWGEFIAFNNPRRESWEKTSKILEFLKIKPGDAVADVGSGPGYYTFKFSDMVGEDGRVYAVDTSQDMLDYIIGVARRQEIDNIRPVLARGNDTRLPPDSADFVYICSLYHAVYLTSIEYVKDQFIESIRRALKKDGRLVIVDNQVLSASQVPYYGPRIARDLIILQLKHYGFRLVDSAQFIPQRYILVFQKI
ncbi:MAG: methyltransferase domain-containing protein [Candidatus Competibacteraceae bacterium]